MRGNSVVPSLQCLDLQRKCYSDDGEYLYPSFFEVFPYDQKDVQIVCHTNAVYNLPTKELIEFLSEAIGGRSAIEICCGAGHIGKALGIPCTDLKLQERPEIKAEYKNAGQPTVNYGKHVEKLEALEAVEKYSPDVVIGSWVTPKFDVFGSPLNMYGTDELEIIKRCKCYIHIGKDSTHQYNPSEFLPHRRYQALWIMGRGSDRLGNHISIWGDVPRMSPKSLKYKMEITKSTPSKKRYKPTEGLEAFNK